MKKEMKIVLPFYKIAYAVSFVVILSVIRAVVFTYEIGLSIEPPFAILTAVFCADTYVQEITSNRSEVQRLYQIKKRIYSIIQRLMIQGTFLLLLAVLGYGLFFAFQKSSIERPKPESKNKGIRPNIYAKLKLWNDIVTMIIHQTFYWFLNNSTDFEMEI